MIRILHVLATLKRAGAETMATSLVRRLDPALFRPGIVSLFDAFPGGLESELGDIPVMHLRKKPGFDPMMWPRLRRVLRIWRPDIVHTHSYVMRYTWPVMNCRGVHTVHNLAAREVDWAGRLIHRAAFRRGVVPVAVAEEVARSFREVYGFPAAAIIPNGIDTERYYRPKARKRWRWENGFDSDEVLIVSVARLEPQKNPGLLISAFLRLPGHCRLLLAGGGSLRNALPAHERVHLLGVRTDIPELLSACDVFAMASDWEGHPISVMEAMAAGLPVAATAVGGIPEIVPANAGRLAPAGDAAALADALAYVVEHRQDLGLEARRHALAFDVSRMVAAYSELYQRIAA